MDKACHPDYSREKMRYFRALIVSLTLHLILTLGLALVPVDKNALPKRTAYVELLEKPELPRRRFPTY